MCVHTARGDRREGVSTWFSLDFVKGFQLDVQRGPRVSVERALG